MKKYFSIAMLMCSMTFAPPKTGDARTEIINAHANVYNILVQAIDPKYFIAIAPENNSPEILQDILQNKYPEQQEMIQDLFKKSDSEAAKLSTIAHFLSIATQLPIFTAARNETIEVTPEQNEVANITIKSAIHIDNLRTILMTKIENCSKTINELSPEQQFVRIKLLQDIGIDINNAYDVNRSEQRLSELVALLENQEQQLQYERNLRLAVAYVGFALYKNENMLSSNNIQTSMKIFLSFIAAGTIATGVVLMWLYLSPQTKSNQAIAHDIGSCINAKVSNFTNTTQVRKALTDCKQYLDFSASDMQNSITLAGNLFYGIVLYLYEHRMSLNILFAMYDKFIKFAYVLERL